MSASFGTRLAALLLPLALSSCLNVRYSRFVHLQEPGGGDYSSLVPGRSELSGCLDLLGAPLIVQEHDGGSALAWGWFESSDWTFSLQAPLGDESASVSFQSVDGRMRGLLLLFDERWQLTKVRTGYLRQLGAELERRRPQYVEGD